LITVTQSEELILLLSPIKADNKRIGFVPTMGALHEGHLSLIKIASTKCDIIVVSIFVNPTQFNNQADYDKYPRNYQDDIQKLSHTDCAIVYLPSIQDIYPNAGYKTIDFEPTELITLLEGKYRTGHFSGMLAVVKRLFDLIQPDIAFLGQKDYQQQLLIRAMVAHYRLPIDVFTADTVREADGLAMSSRNVRLSINARQKAPIIYRTMLQALDRIKLGHSIDIIKLIAIKQLSEMGNFIIDYFDICNAETLQSVDIYMPDNKLIILTAVHADGVRLIDNMLVK